MKFESKTEAQIEREEQERLEALLFPKGEYDFQVRVAVDKTSKSGNEMIELDLDIFDAGGNKRSVRDWLLPSFPKKLVHFARGAGLIAEYEAGSLEAYQCEGKTGRVSLDIEPANGQYSAKNKVVDYLASDSAPAAAAPKRAPPSSPDLDDEIPF